MSERLYGGGLLRFAERVFDRDTVERVIAPSIADLQHECANAGDGPSRFAVCARAYWGVLKAIALCMLREAVTDRHRAGRRLAVHMLGFMVLFLALTLIPQLRWTIDLGTKHGAATAVEASLLWLPSQLILILPAALFFAIVLQHERVDTTRPSLVPTIGAGVVACTIVLFALMMFAAPEANQAFRTVVSDAYTKASGEPARELRRGLSEMTLPMLNDHIAHAPSSFQEARARKHRHMRFAFIALVPIMALLGLSLVDRWRSRLVTLAAAIAIVFLYSFCLNAGTDRFGNTSLYGPWTANVLFFVLAVRLLRTRTAAQRA